MSDKVPKHRHVIELQNGYQYFPVYDKFKLRKPSKISQVSQQ